MLLLLAVSTGCLRQWDEPMLIAYYYLQNIYVMDENGANKRQLTYSSDCAGGPSFSPTGQQIVFCRLIISTYYICIINTDGTGGRLLCTGYMNPTWSPDGKRIVYATNPPTYSINIINSDGSGMEEIGASNYTFPLSWSPDGSMIMATHAGSNNMQLFTIGNTTPQIMPQTGLGGISWSPDGTRVLYSSSYLYTLNYSDLSTAQVSNIYGDSNGSWSSDGSKIVCYNSDTATMILINLETGDRTDLGFGNYPCFQFKPR